MSFYVSDLEKDTVENDNFRKVLNTEDHSQLVVMSLEPNEEIGMETHPDIDQFIRIEQGKAKVIIDNEEYKVEDDFAAVVPAGSKHNVVNTSKDEELKLYAIYSPPEHPDGVVHKDKVEAEKYEEEHH